MRTSLCSPYTCWMSDNHEAAPLGKGCGAFWTCTGSVPVMCSCWADDIGAYLQIGKKGAFGDQIPFADPCWYQRQVDSPYYKDTHRKFRAEVREFVDKHITGIGWFYEKEDSAQLAKLHLIDFGPGGDSDNGGTWSIITSINLFGTQSDWHLLGIDYDSATGAVIARYDNQVFNFNTITGMYGTFYVGYRESLTSVPLAKVRPATFDVIPEPSSFALAIVACCGLAVRRKSNA